MGEGLAVKKGVRIHVRYIRATTLYRGCVQYYVCHICTTVRGGGGILEHKCKPCGTRVRVCRYESVFFCLEREERTRSRLERVGRDIFIVVGTPFADVIV